MMVKGSLRWTAVANFHSLRVVTGKGNDLRGGPVCSFHSATSPCLSPAASGTVRSYDEIPGNWRNSLASLYTFWKLGGLKNIHRIMVNNFNAFGPIYREKVGYYESVNIINPEDAAILFKAEGRYPERLTVEAWTAYRDYRNRKYGVLLK